MVKVSIAKLTVPHQPHLPAPRPLKAPKIAAINFKPIKKGTGVGTAMQVTHHMTNGLTKRFLFSDPSKVGPHLMKINRSAWRNPSRNAGTATAHELDLGPG